MLTINMKILKKLINKLDNKLVQEAKSCKCCNGNCDEPENKK